MLAIEVASPFVQENQRLIRVWKSHLGHFRTVLHYRPMDEPLAQSPNGAGYSEWCQMAFECFDFGFITT